MKNVLLNLLKVKSIITLATVFTLCYLTIKGVVPIELFIPLVSMIIAFYFNKDKNKEA